MKTRFATTAKLVATLVVAGLLSLALAAPASASARSKGTYMPEQHGNTLTAWANLELDCSNTLGCWNYIKIQQLRWFGWQTIAGQWANNNGWNSISTEIPGCGTYRTQVRSYNDIVVADSDSAEAGGVGASQTRSKIQRFETHWESDPIWYCRQ